MACNMCVKTVKHICDHIYHIMLYAMQLKKFSVPAKFVAPTHDYVSDRGNDSNLQGCVDKQSMKVVCRKAVHECGM